MVKTLLAGLALLLVMPVSGCGQETQLGPRDGFDLPPTDLERVGVGTEAPEFVLESSDGKRIALSNYRGSKNVVLVFYRGHW